MDGMFGGFRPIHDGSRTPISQGLPKAITGTPARCQNQRCGTLIHQLTMYMIWDAHDVFFDWLLKKNPRHLCLHSAAVCMGDGLVCFPSVQKAGKSTMCVALVSVGYVLYCDDVLPIEPDNNRGMALGIAPLLRRPVPLNLGPVLTRFIQDRAKLSSRSWSYVNLDDHEIAPLGDLAPINALVLLHRENRYRAKLEPVPRNEMLKEIVLQNFAHQVPPVEILDRLLHLTERAGCYRLRYNGLSNAVNLLEKRFGKRVQGSMVKG
jgi:hypothetical protein